MNAIITKLEPKWICIKCNTVHNGKTGQCPDCGCQYSCKVQ